MSDTDQTLFRIDHINLTNFQCFDHFEVPLHPELTVFVAANAQGKTSCLNGISYAIDAYSSIALQDQAQTGLHRDDVRRTISDEGTMKPELPCSYFAEGVLGNKSIKWGLRLNTIGLRARAVREDSKAFTKLASGFLASGLESNETLPLTAFYGTGRLHSSHKLTEGKKAESSDSRGRRAAFVDALSPSSSIKVVSDWFGDLYRTLANKAESGPVGDVDPLSALTAVREAVSRVLQPTDWTIIDWEQSTAEDSISSLKAGYMVVENPNDGRRLPLNFMSDGVRTMVGLVADLALRCAKLNPHLRGEAAIRTPGVVLIDEIDLHLHPSWQQKIVGLLQAAFPAIQFIISTHSPQVISTVPYDSIRILKDGKAFSAPHGTEGAEAQRILRTVFGTDPRPDTETARWLDEYLRLVDNRKWDSDRAKELRKQLDEWSQGNEPRLLEADLQIDNMKWEAGL